MHDLLFRAFNAVIRPFRGNGLRNHPFIDRAYRAIHARLHPPYVFIYGRKFYLDRHDSLEFSTRRFEPEEFDVFVNHVPANGAVVVDVGAHIGWYTLVASCVGGPSAKVIAIEPDPENCKLLRKTLAANGIVNVQLVEKAAGPSNGTAMLFLSGVSNDNRCYDPTDGRTRRVQVETVRLDDLLRDYPTIDLIKMDVDGFEADALKGMHESLRKTRIFITEFCPDFLRKAGADPRRYLETIQRLGFALYTLDQRPASIAPLVGGGCTNLLCINRTRAAITRGKPATAAASAEAVPR